MQSPPLTLQSKMPLTLQFFFSNLPLTLQFFFQNCLLRSQFFFPKLPFHALDRFGVGGAEEFSVTEPLGLGDGDRPRFTRRPMARAAGGVTDADVTGVQGPVAKVAAAGATREGEPAGHFPTGRCSKQSQKP